MLKKKSFTKMEDENSLVTPVTHSGNTAALSCDITFGLREAALP